MAIRIDENTIFEDGRMKKISKAKEEPKTVEAETKEEPKTEEAKEEPKSKAGRKPKAPIKGKEA